MNPSFDVIFVIHQIGSGADGGIRSISEIVRFAPALRKAVVTNSGPAVGKDWADHAAVSQWPMPEGHYARAGRGVGYRLGQVLSRAANNMRMYFFVRRSGAQVVHCNDHRAFWNAALGARAAGAKVIFNVRDTMRAESRSRLAWRLALKWCDLFLVLSKEMIEAWKKDLLPTSSHPAQMGKFRFLYSIVDGATNYPVEASERLDIRARLGIHEDVLAVVYVGRFDDKKAQLDFIRHAVPGLLRRQPRAAVYFVGDFEPERDEYAAACRSQADRPELAGRVHFVGYCTRTADWYRAADVVALASRREGLPRCVIEALACGAPVASFAVCSVREVLEEGRSGIVVPQGDHDGLARAIAELLGDPAKRRRLAIRGPELARELFDAERSGERYSALVRRLAGQEG